MAIANLFGLGQGGKSPNVSAQRHLNLYAEIQPEMEKARWVYYGTPGLTLFYSFGDTPVRGSFPLDNLIYQVHRGTFYEVNNAGVKTARGTLATTSGRVQIAYNGTQIALVDGTGYYVYTISTNTFVTVTANLIGVPIDVTFQDGYGILIYANGRFQLTASYDFTTLDALDYATAESNPDGLIRGVADHGELVLLGSLTTEFWGNSGGLDFPYTNQRGTTLEYGLAAAQSLVKYNDSLAGLFKNAMGQVQIMQMRGHALVAVSNPEIEYLINSYPAVSDATAYSYLLGGHPMLQINFPSANKSWLYDGLSQMWSPLEYGLSGNRHRGEIRFDFLNKPRVTDYANGNVYTLDANAYTDNGVPIVRELIAKQLFAGVKQRIAVHWLGVNMESGVGLNDGQGSDPQIMLQISKDGGHTWGNELWTSFGKIGEYAKRAFWTRLGSAFDWTFKFRITDPVKVVMTFPDVITETWP